MNTLVVGIGALGGVIATRMTAAGLPVRLATRTAESATALARAGLRVGGVGAAQSVATPPVAPLDDYRAGAAFDLVVLATKAHEAVALAPRLVELLAADGVIVPIQNGAVSQTLAAALGEAHLVGGLSNLGASTLATGVYEQRNAGHLLIGEIGGGDSERARRVGDWLGRGLDVRVSPNLAGAIWSKLLLNCSVTTIGAIAGCTMRQYVARPDGRALFERVYDEALAVAHAAGVRPERMIVDPIPPARDQAGAYDAWLGRVLDGYGDVKASMLHDFEQRRRTEIDFINGYVVRLGGELGVATAANAASVDIVAAIERGELAPDRANLARALTGLPRI